MHWRRQRSNLAVRYLCTHPQAPWASRSTVQVASAFPLPEWSSHWPCTSSFYLRSCLFRAFPRTRNWYPSSAIWNSIRCVLIYRELTSRSVSSMAAAEPCQSSLPTQTMAFRSCHWMVATSCQSCSSSWPVCPEIDFESSSSDPTSYRSLARCNAQSINYDYNNYNYHVWIRWIHDLTSKDGNLSWEWIATYLSSAFLLSIWALCWSVAEAPLCDVWSISLMCHLQIWQIINII